MRAHGTHACFVHGPEKGSVKGGCRCDPCRAANAAYERERAKRTAPPYVGSSNARSHVRELQAGGMGWKSVALAAGLSPSVLWKLLYGDPSRNMEPSKRIRRATEQAILSVTLGDASDAALIDSAACRADITTLLARGWSKVAIARALGQNGPGLQLACLRDPDLKVQAATARKVHALLDLDPVTRRSRTGAHIPAPEVDEPVRVPVESPDPPPTLDPAVFDEPWRRRAACRLLPDGDRWVFWPGRGDTAALRAAKAVCASCPVSGECLDYAVSAGERGVWGGTSEKERRTMRRIRAAS